MHLDIDGVYQWGRMIGSNTQYDNMGYHPFDIADENNNSYAIGMVNYHGSTYNDCFITKFNSSGSTSGIIGSIQTTMVNGLTR